jgi:hypothetical protein
MDDIYTMIKEFEDRGYTIEQISTITGYSREELEVYYD